MNFQQVFFSKTIIKEYLHQNDQQEENKISLSVTKLTQNLRKHFNEICFFVFIS